MTAKSVNTNERTIELSNGKVLKYDKLLLATGGTPSRPSDIKGVNLQNVYLLRDHKD